MKIQSLISMVQQQLQPLDNVESLLLGYSGGLDSHVLLHILTHHTSYPLTACHVNHGLSAHSHQWVQQCQQVCQQWQVPLQIKTIDLSQRKGAGLEAAAREKRYQVFADELKPHAILITAHHQQDQAETLLLQLMRGAGPKGLSAMPAKKPFAKGWHCRPLLSVSREQLLAYAKHYQLTWIDDESNASIDFDRNYIRHQILPVLQQRWGQVHANIARSAELCAQQQKIIEPYGEQLLGQVMEQDKLNLTHWPLYSAEQQLLILRHWLDHLAFTSPHYKHLRLIQQQIIQAKVDASPLLALPHLEIRRYQHFLYAMKPLTSQDANREFHWPQHQHLLDEKTQSWLSELTLSPEDDVVIRFRRGGEKILLKGQHKSVKKCLQQWQIPPWLREQIPLVFVNQTLVMVVGYAVADSVRVKSLC